MSAMTLTRALEMVRDLPDDELALVGQELQQAMFEAIERYNTAAGEIVRRMTEVEAEAMAMGSTFIEKSTTKKYDWDVDAVREIAPDFVIDVPEEIIPAHPRVKNTTALNNHIKKLGKTPTAQALKAARRVSESNPKLTFSTIDASGEITPDRGN